MDRSERFYTILKLLESRRAVPLELFLEELEISKATFKRDLEYLRDRLFAPIVWDRQRRGYVLDGTEPRFQLPGVWFSEQELYALVLSERVIRELEPGLLAQTLAPLKFQIDHMLASEGRAVAELERRIRIVSFANREVSPSVMTVLLASLVERHQLDITHHSRARDTTESRRVSPQRLVRYRDNWYLDTYCHRRNAVRTFAADTITSARRTEDPAMELDAAQLDSELSRSFGIFAGGELKWARLAFSPNRARWVADEKWHPQQKGVFGEGGEYLLEVPYTEDHELVMEILKFGDDCTVLGPPALCSKVKEAAARVLAKYAASSDVAAG